MNNITTSELIELRIRSLELAIRFVKDNPQEEQGETLRQTAEKFYNFIVHSKVEDDVK